MRCHLLLLLGLLPSLAIAELSLDRVVSESRISRGLCVFPRMKDEKLPFEIAASGRYVVQVQREDHRRVIELRRKAEKQGLLARNLYCVHSRSHHAITAPGTVDVLVISDLRDADLSPKNIDSWCESLAPRRGVAILGQQGKTVDGLSLEKLKGVAARRPDTRVIHDESGKWLLLKRPPTVGMDEWNHHRHGADNNYFSKDTVLKPPFLTKWWGLPLHHGFWGSAAVTANGRLFTIMASKSSRQKLSLLCRSANNWILLWERKFGWEKLRDKFGGGYFPGRSCMVAKGERLYLVAENDILYLNAEDGREEKKIQGPVHTKQVKWLALEGSVLLALYGSVDRYLIQYTGPINVAPGGTHLIAYKANSGEVLWSSTEPGEIDERMIAVHRDRLYGQVQGKHLICREVKTGKVVWKNADPEVVARIDARSKGGNRSLNLLQALPALIVNEQAIITGSRATTNIVALDPKTGKQLWTMPQKSYGRSLRTAASGDKLFDFLAGKAYSLRTGKPVSMPSRLPYDGCGPTLLTDAYYVTLFGGVRSIQSGEVFKEADVKGPCDVGTIISDGMGFSLGGQCRCNYEQQGYHAFATKERAKHLTGKNRLSTFQRTATFNLTSDSLDWACARHDNRRSGHAPVKVGVASAALWHWKPAKPISYAVPTYQYRTHTGKDPEYLPGHPVCVGHRLWFVDAQGIVRSLNADTGEEIWSHPLGVKVFASPTFWKGRLYVGDGNGVVSCFDADKGALLWQLNAAPAKRSVFWYGHLINTWPIVSGVTIEKDTAYVIAGYLNLNGISALAFKPETGEVIWEKHDAASGGEYGVPSGFGCYGPAAVSADRLWFSSGTAVPGSISLRDGSWYAYKSANINAINRGKFVGALTSELLIAAARRLTSTQEKWDKSSGRITAYQAKARDTESFHGCNILTNSVVVPAWDDAIFVATTKGHTALAAWRTKTLVALAGGKLAEKLKGKVKPMTPRITSLFKSRRETSPPNPLWKPVGVAVYALALSDDLIIVAHNDPKRRLNGRPMTPENNPCQISGINRTDGSLSWTLPLPAVPVFDGIVINRKGRILVPLIDGSLVCLD